MRNKAQRIVFAALLLAVTHVALPAAGQGDRLGRLIRILQTDASYKVRLQVVIALGKLKDLRAVPALIRALSDDNYTVRGVAASTLGQLGDRRALAALQRASRSDGNEFVRSQAAKALAELSGGRSTGPARGARFFITVGKMTNKARTGGAVLADAFRDALLKEFGKVSGVATPWSSSNPSAAELRKLKLTGFVLDGSILTLTRTPRGSGFELSCSIRVSLATYPGNSMKAFYSGGASMEIEASSFKLADEVSLFKDVVEGAAQGAQEHIVRSYLSTQ